MAAKPKLLKVVVKRKKWLRRISINKGGGWLLNHQGKMCCLGFACLAAKMEADAILNKEMPYDALPNGADLPTPLRRLGYYVQGTLAGSSRVAGELARTNDSLNLTDKDREISITSLGKKAGIAFTFID